MWAVVASAIVAGDIAGAPDYAMIAAMQRAVQKQRCRPGSGYAAPSHWTAHSLAVNSADASPGVAGIMPEPYVQMSHGRAKAAK